MSLFAFQNFFFLFSVRPWFGPWIGPKFGWAKRGLTGRVWAPGKINPFNKRAEFGPRVLARGSGSSMKKPDPNPIRCHSYLYSAICTRVILLFTSNILLCCIVRNKLWLKIQMTVSFLYRSDFVKIVLGGVWFVFSNNYFSVFKQYFTYFHTLFHPHVFLQIFSNNNFQFLKTCTNLPLSFYPWACCQERPSSQIHYHIRSTCWCIYQESLY